LGGIAVEAVANRFFCELTWPALEWPRMFAYRYWRPLRSVFANGFYVQLEKMGMGFLIPSSVFIVYPALIKRVWNKWVERRGRRVWERDYEYRGEQGSKWRTRRVLYEVDEATYRALRILLTIVEETGDAWIYVMEQTLGEEFLDSPEALNSLFIESY